MELGKSVMISGGLYRKVAQRLAWSLRRVKGLMPLDASAMACLTPEDEEKFDAFRLRFNTLAVMMQDHLTQAFRSRIEEADIKEASRKDQTLLMESSARSNRRSG